MADAGFPISDVPFYPQQRTVPRYGFVAQVDIIEPISGVRISGRVSEISRKGCFIDILNTLPKETYVRLVISRPHGKFSSQGRVIYVQDRMGMGIAFVDPALDQMRVLDGWLVNLGNGR